MYLIETMCYFMCLAVPDAARNVHDAFDQRVTIKRADDTSIGRVTMGDAGEAAYLLTVNGCSCDLFRGGHKMDAQPDLVLSGLQKLLSGVPEVWLVVHWFTDYPDRQSVTSTGDKKVKQARLSKLLPDLEADLRYTVTP